MLGTFVNVLAIIIGAIIGSTLKRGMKEKYQNNIMVGAGLVALSLGISWVAKSIPQSKYSVLFVASMIIGAYIGEVIDLDSKVNSYGARFKESNLLEGITTTVLLFCVGTLSILGPIESALKGDNTLLFTNAILDGFTSIVFAANFGIGIVITAGILFLWQGALFMSAQFISPIITPDMLNEISIIGGILLITTGLNILNIKKIKTLNLLPALLIPIVFFTIKGILN
ncbi:DUF554 domain-containing protein [Clostridium cylindrosporum]|uniref:DUF554 domain-containing protein n=1 Tax=Clostridium cylindrosporum DSM 605 TaxID=1121307 RepID=A0A0J8D8X2_CLOCY|nr:DUF554 domain-containing protein [Clostridium cylindrosporum]KMT20804.1 hypothetical protein CLCY_1c00360 [Clostridium cylindrosporum DSM 605]